MCCYLHLLLFTFVASDWNNANGKENATCEDGWTGQEVNGRRTMVFDPDAGKTAACVIFHRELAFTSNDKCPQLGVSLTLNWRRQTTMTEVAKRMHGEFYDDDDDDDDVFSFHTPLTLTCTRDANVRVFVNDKHFKWSDLSNRNLYLTRARDNETTTTLELFHVFCHASKYMMQAVVVFADIDYQDYARNVELTCCRRSIPVNWAGRLSMDEIDQTTVPQPMENIIEDTCLYQPDIYVPHVALVHETSTAFHVTCGLPFWLDDVPLCNRRCTYSMHLVLEMENEKTGKRYSFLATSVGSTSCNECVTGGGGMTCVVGRIDSSTVLIGIVPKTMIRTSGDDDDWTSLNAKCTLTRNGHRRTTSGLIPVTVFNRMADKLETDVDTSCNCTTAGEPCKHCIGVTGHVRKVSEKRDDEKDIEKTCLNIAVFVGVYLGSACVWFVILFMTCMILKKQVKHFKEINIPFSQFQAFSWDSQPTGVGERMQKHVLVQNSDYLPMNISVTNSEREVVHQYGELYFDTVSRNNMYEPVRTPPTSPRLLPPLPPRPLLETLHEEEEEE